MPRFSEASGAEKQVDFLPPLCLKKKALLPLELALGSLHTSKGFSPQLQGLKGATESFSEEGMATHSSIPAWRNPWTEEPGGL